MPNQFLKFRWCKEDYIVASFYSLKKRNLAWYIKQSHFSLNSSRQWMVRWKTKSTVLALSSVQSVLMINFNKSSLKKKFLFLKNLKGSFVWNSREFMKKDISRKPRFLINSLRKNLQMSSLITTSTNLTTSAPKGKRVS